MAADKSGWVVGRILAEQARTRPDAPLIQFERGHMHTYAEVHALANRAGNGYADIGVGFGDNVAVMLNNRLEYLWSWFGLSRIGGVLVGINTALKGTFLTHVLSNTKARIGVFEPEFLPWLGRSRIRCPTWPWSMCRAMFMTPIACLPSSASKCAASTRS